jgi:hypothetical protein
MRVADFPLAWRWTSPSHSVLPAEVLSSLAPLTPEAACSLSKKVPPALGGKGLVHNATDMEETARWLKALPVTCGTATIVWNTSTALTLPWNVFITYWSDFCYPASGL